VLGKGGRVLVLTGHYALTVPRTWVSVDHDQLVAVSQGRVTLGNTDVDAYLVQLGTQVLDLDFVAFDDLQPGVTFQVLDAAHLTDITNTADELRAGLVKLYQDLPQRVGKVTSAPFEASGLSGFSVSFAAKVVAANGGSITSYATEYVLVEAERTYAFTIAGDKRYPKTWKMIADSFEALP
jgi:hypothetical protein